MHSSEANQSGVSPSARPSTLSGHELRTVRDVYRLWATARAASPAPQAPGTTALAARPRRSMLKAHVRAPRRAPRPTTRPTPTPRRPMPRTRPAASRRPTLSRAPRPARRDPAPNSRTTSSRSTRLKKPLHQEPPRAAHAHRPRSRPIFCRVSRCSSRSPPRLAPRRACY